MLLQADVVLEVQDLRVLQYFLTLMKTLMAPVKSADSSTSVWSIFRAPVGGGGRGSASEQQQQRNLVSMQEIRGHT